MILKTIAFYVRFCIFQLVSGLIALALGAWSLLTYSQTAATVTSRHFSTPIADVAYPMAWVTLLVGAGLLVQGWIHATQIRRGF